MATSCWSLALRICSLQQLSELAVVWPAVCRPPPTSSIALFSAAPICCGAGDASTAIASDDLRRPLGAASRPPPGVVDCEASSASREPPRGDAPRGGTKLEFRRANERRGADGRPATCCCCASGGDDCTCAGLGAPIATDTRCQKLQFGSEQISCCCCVGLRSAAHVVATSCCSAASRSQASWCSFVANGNQSTLAVAVVELAPPVDSCKSTWLFAAEISAAFSWFVSCSSKAAGESRSICTQTCC